MIACLLSSGAPPGLVETLCLRSVERALGWRLSLPGECFFFCCGLLAAILLLCFVLTLARLFVCALKRDASLGEPVGAQLTAQELAAVQVFSFSLSLRVFSFSLLISGGE